MKKRIFSAVFTVLMLMLTIVPSFADTNISSFTADGYCYTTFIADGELSKNSSQTWYRFKAEPQSITYMPSGSSYSNAYARPQGLDGTLYGTQFSIYCGHETKWIPNNSGKSANKVKFKFYNAENQNNGTTVYQAHIVCDVRGSI